MGILEIILAGLVVCLAGVAQSAIGFGYALFSTPLLLWIGVPLPTAIALVATCSMIQSMIGARRLRADVPWRTALVATSVREAAVIAGLIVLRALAKLDTAYIKAVVGAVLCALVALQFVWRPEPKPAMHWGWAGLSFTSSGFLAGVTGMGGPPLVLWSMAHDWPARRTRGFLFATFATAIPVQIAIMVFSFGGPVLRGAGLGIAFAPLVFLGAAVGLPVGNRMGRDKLRAVAYLVLLVIGAGAVVPAALRHLV